MIWKTVWRIDRAKIKAQDGLVRHLALCFGYFDLKFTGLENLCRCLAALNLLSHRPGMF